MNTRTLLNNQLIENVLLYDEHFFVNRSEEADLIEGYVRDLRSGETPQYSVVNFWGVAGIGKTWLLRHLEEKYRFDENRFAIGEKSTFVISHEFKNHDGNFGKFTVIAVKQIIEQLEKYLSEEVLNELQESSSSPHGISVVIRYLSEEFIPILLLDNTENFTADDWQTLERGFIEPIVSTGRALVVVAGRRQSPSWLRLEVRRRSQKHRILPFSKQDVDSQILKHQYPLPPEILFPYSAGNPRVVDSLAQHILAWREGTKESELIPLDATWIQSNRDALAMVLRHSEHYILEGVQPEWKQLLRKIATVRYFRPETLKEILRSENNNEQPDGYYLRLARSLDQMTDVVRWDREYRGYALNEDIRRLMDRKTLLEDKNLYLDRHQRALEIYWKLAKENRRSGAEFIREIWFQAASIYVANEDALLLKHQIDKSIEFAHHNFSYGDEIVILSNEFEADVELKDILPRNVENSISSRLVNIV